MKVDALRLALQMLAVAGAYDVAEEAERELEALIKASETLRTYADEANWAQAPNEDWDQWWPSKHGYTAAQRALGE